MQVHKYTITGLNRSKRKKIAQAFFKFLDKFFFKKKID